MRTLKDKQHILKSWNSRNNKAKRVEKARRAINARWSRYHADLKDEPVRQNLPDPLYEMTFRNNLTGKVHEIEFHYLNSKSFRVTDNGQDWLIVGFSKILSEIRKRCPRVRKEG